MLISVYKDQDNNPTWFTLIKGDLSSWQQLANEKDKLFKIYFIDNEQQQQAADAVFYKTHSFDAGILKNENGEQIASAKEVEFTFSGEQITGLRIKV